jgi:hypothetical protein
VRPRQRWNPAERVCAPPGVRATRKRKATIQPR